LRPQPRLGAVARLGKRGAQPVFPAIVPSQRPRSRRVTLAGRACYKGAKDGLQPGKFRHFSKMSVLSFWGVDSKKTRPYTPPSLLTGPRAARLRGRKSRKGRGAAG